MSMLSNRELLRRVMKDLEERGFTEIQDNGSMVIRERIEPLD